jgi:hypothetical protein
MQTINKFLLEECTDISDTVLQKPLHFSGSLSDNSAGDISAQSEPSSSRKTLSL